MLGVPSADASTGSHPPGNAIVRTLPLRASQRKAPRTSHAVANASVALTSCVAYPGDPRRPPKNASPGPMKMI